MGYLEQTDDKRYSKQRMQAQFLGQPLGRPYVGAEVALKDVSFHGQRCRKCGQEQFPFQRVCFRCYSPDDFEAVRLSDRTGRRKPWVVAGYTLAGAARPLIGLATSWPAVLGLRFADRVGKGLRASPRDALISATCPPQRRGEAFGVQRAFDHAGAVLGPLVAAGLLLLPGMTVRHVFLAAALPAVVVVIILALAVREPTTRPVPATPPAGDWGRLGRRFHWVLLAVVVFTLGNSTDAFLLLRLSQAGMTPALVATSWSLLHLVKVAATYAGGRFSDRFGRRPVLASIYAGRVLIFAGFFLIRDNPAAIILVAVLGGITMAGTGSMTSALTADIYGRFSVSSVFGLIFLVHQTGAAIGSWLAGALFESTGGYGAAFTVACALLVVAAVVALKIDKDARRIWRAATASAR